MFFRYRIDEVRKVTCWGWDQNGKNWKRCSERSRTVERWKL